MLTLDELRKLLIMKFKYTPTSSQTVALEKLAHWLTSSDSQPILLLKGYAGTGKTSLLSALVQTLNVLKRSFVLMAPTGRAAKVMTEYTGIPATTIHSTIYRVTEGTWGEVQFILRKNSTPSTLFIVDEASMIGSQDTWESSSLLNDLLTYVNGAPECALLLVGDTAQLLPVHEDYSAALDKDYLSRRWGYVDEILMQEVVRQKHRSGVLEYATLLREAMERFPYHVPILPMGIYPDIKPIKKEKVAEAVAALYVQGERDETIIITHSNRQARDFNHAVRAHLYNTAEAIVPGERLMVCHNSYDWTAEEPSIPFIANGDMIIVKRVYNPKQLGRFSFVTIEFTLEQKPNIVLSATAMLHVLSSQSSSLNSEERKELMQYVLQEEGMPRGERKQQILRKSPYLNALQLKYGYAITCHKAQGGQWKQLFLSPTYWNARRNPYEYLRWLYTAFTRATQGVYVIGGSIQGQGI